MMHLLGRSAVVVCAVWLLGCQGERAQQAETWRFAIEETLGSVQHTYATRFEELIEERSGGAIDVIVYPYGTLGTSDHITEQLHNGTLQLATASPGHLGKLIPEVQVFLLHFALSSDPQLNHRVLRDEALVRLLDGLYRRKGLRFLSAFSEGWMAWTTKKPVRRPEDFDGVKMRTMTSPLLLAAYEAYGADPTPLPYSEVYSALQLGMIDAQVNPVFAIQEMSFYEVTDHLIFPRHAQFYATLATNPAFHEGLSADRRALLHGVLDELHEEVFEIQRTFNAERLEIIRERRPDLEVYTLTPEEQAAFRERARTLRDIYLDIGGPMAAEVLATVEAALERAR